MSPRTCLTLEQKLQVHLKLKQNPGRNNPMLAEWIYATFKARRRRVKFPQFERELREFFFQNEAKTAMADDVLLLKAHVLDYDYAVLVRAVVGSHTESHKSAGRAKATVSSGEETEPRRKKLTSDDVLLAVMVQAAVARQVAPLATWAESRCPTGPKYYACNQNGHYARNCTNEEAKAKNDAYLQTRDTKTVSENSKRAATNNDEEKSLMVTKALDQTAGGGAQMAASRGVEGQIRGRVRVLTATMPLTKDDEVKNDEVTDDEVNDDDANDDEETKEESSGVEDNEDEMSERGRTACCASWSAGNLMNEIMQLMRTEAESKDSDRAAQYVATGDVELEKARHNPVMTMMTNEVKLEKARRWLTQRQLWEAEMEATATTTTNNEDEGNATPESMTNDESPTKEESTTTEVVQATAGVTNGERKGNQTPELAVSNESMTDDESAVNKASVMTDTLAGNDKSTVSALTVTAATQTVIVDDGEVNSTVTDPTEMGPVTNTALTNDEDVHPGDGGSSSAGESSSDSNERAGSDVEQARLTRKKARKAAKRLRNPMTNGAEQRPKLWRHLTNEDSADSMTEMTEMTNAQREVTNAQQAVKGDDVEYVGADDGLPTATMEVGGVSWRVKLGSCARYTIAGTEWMVHGDKQTMNAPVDYVEGIGGFLLDFLLGVDFMRARGATMDFDRNEVRYVDGERAVVIPFRTHDGAGGARVAAVQMVSRARLTGNAVMPVEVSVAAEDGERGLFVQTRHGISVVGSDGDDGSERKGLARLPNKKELGTWVPVDDDMQILSMGDSTTPLDDEDELTASTGDCPPATALDIHHE
ncbi:hypothetical protein PHYSODRAFT_329160 [Phytophthora sojae]|uniref:CCHC-type domain-containing protein n=1 Tax=Phytophthora sojae (strain P6497) TaxID=1094619 RepID=G4Z979_PHYSP|nr:hypothetical protein PHYSODRAFT_329160 [Phytophthora sojae]EGZ21133.1 hypothetical protein PHYSODRAFT_329160 [Phytophthora sojae]|eukprot:XP_009523850.1 hypothetical protein PHYSODRAFT_329160 [Phytophthora sojae]